uniref:Ig-like domain repeat protein n=1 Tax=Aeromicrobium sp. TaxID=1871063 RepID=UPI002FC8945A
FSSAGAAPTLLNPSPGASVLGNGALFTWESSSTTAPVASYRLNLTAPPGKTSPAAVTTSARAYAWPALLADGTWTWTVTALDGSGASLGTSAARSFIVSYPSLVKVTSPSFTGTRTVGSTLTASPGSFGSSAAGPAVAATYKYQWLRGGGAISGATGKTYKLVAADAARSISVRVTATAAGYAPGSANSAAGVVAKLRSTTAVRLKATRIKRGTRGTLYVTVTAALPKTGAIRVYDGSRLIKTMTLVASNGGKKTFLLPVLTLGRHSLQARYAGNAQIAASNSPRIVLYVVR